MTSTYDYVIIGDGIAARCVLYYMSQSDIHRNSTILQISSDTFFAACSSRTTSVVSKGMHTKGISELGDLICDSLISFENYLAKNSPPGVYLAKQYSIPTREQNQRLNIDSEIFGVKVSQTDCYQINADIFLADMKARAISNLGSYCVLNDVCIEIKKNTSQVVTKISGDINYTNLILCTGPYTNFLLGNTNEEMINDGKPVAGSYFQWEGIDYEESFVLTKGHFNIIYRKDDKTLLFGGTSFEGLVFTHNLVELTIKYKDLCQEYSKVNFPKIDSAKVYTGIRHKGKKRMPQQISVGNIHILNCLYKNGFSFPFLLAQKLVNSCCQ